METFNLSNIYFEIHQEIEKRFNKKNFFKFGMMTLDRSKSPFEIDNLIKLPFETNFEFHIYIIKEEKIELYYTHKFDDRKHVIYSAYFYKNPKHEAKQTECKELDSFLGKIQMMNSEDEPPLYCASDLVDAFMQFKDYILSAEKYYENKKIADKLYEEMKRNEYKVFR